MVCVRSDSRNASKHYTGSKDRIGYFYDGHLNQLIEATKEQCGMPPISRSLNSKSSARPRNAISAMVRLAIQ